MSTSRLIQIAAIGFAANLAEGKDMPNGGLDVKHHDKLINSLRWYEGFRGSWIGLNRGLFKTPGNEMEETCMNNEARNAAVEAMSVWFGSDDLSQGTDQFTAIMDVFVVTANLKKCNFRKPFRDIATFCRKPGQIDPESDQYEDEYAELKNDGKRCSFKVILANLSKHAFELMGSTGTLLETIKEFPAHNPDQLMIQSLTIAEDLGIWTRVALDFVPPFSP